MCREITLLLAGDALITRPWSHVRELGERIIATVATKSKKFGTQIQHDRRTNRGEVVLVD